MQGLSATNIMKKSDLVNEIARRLDKSTAEAKIILEETIGAIKKGVEEDGEVTLRGFGTFKKSTRKAGVGRDFQTGKDFSYPERTYTSFKASKE